MALEKKYLIGICAIFATFSISPIFPAIGIRGGLIFLMSIFFIFLFKLKYEKTNVMYILLILIVFFLSIIPAIKWLSLDRLFLPFYFLASLYVVSLLNREDFKIIISFLTRIFVILLIGAWLGLVYKLNSGSELFSFPNADGRLNYFVPFTFSNSIWPGFIRPSGLFDEPGAFSFFICSLVTLRHIFGMNEFNSLKILLMGFVTFSLAHIIYTAIFLLSMKRGYINFFYIIIFLILFYFLIQITGQYDLLYNVFLIRFTITDSGLFHGDNRSLAFLSAFYALKEFPELIIWGASDELMSNADLFNEFYAHGNETGANPLNLLLRLGIGSIFYYSCLLYFFFKAITIKKQSFSLLGYGLMLMQRDYLFVISYCFITACILVITWKKLKYD